MTSLPDDTVDIRLTSPGQLLANVPALLGFYPAHSVVLMAFDQVGPTRYQLGPVLRFDLDDIDHAYEDDMLELSLNGSDILFAFLIDETLGEEAASNNTTRAVSLCAELASCVGTTLIGVWGVKEIMTGELFTLVSPEVQHRGAAWRCGVIPNVATSPAMQRYVGKGGLPELTREDALGNVSEHNSLLDHATIDNLLKEVHDAAHNSRGAVALLREIVEEAEDAIREAHEDHLDIDDLLVHTRALTAVAKALSRKTTRDALATTVVALPEAGGALMAAVARTFPGIIRADALSLYALAQLSLGRGPSAMAALREAFESVPEHALSMLMWQAYHVRRHNELLDGIAEASEIARADLEEGELWSA